MPKISVILTTHNGRKEFCRKAIESVLDQTFKDFELIIVDDFSQDGTEEMVLEYEKKDNRIVYLRRTENFGNHSRPKNEGIQLAKGEYIAFLDSDNRYRKRHLEFLMLGHEKSKADVVYGDRMIFQNDEAMGVGTTSDFDVGLFLERNFIDTSDFLVKKDLVTAIGGWDERHKRMLDWNLLVRLFKNGATFQRVPTVLTDYYLHDDQLSNKDPNIGWDPISLEVELPFCGHEIKEPRIAVFSLTYDRLDYTKVCFDSLHKTAGVPFDHFVVDNGSTDGTVEYLKDNKMFKTVIYNKQNKGISIASNQALDAIGDNYDIICKVDNDALFKNDGWMKKMVDIWRVNKMVALSCYIEGLRDHPGGAERIGYAEFQGEKIGGTAHLGGICHFVDARAYKNFRWDEDSTLHGVQDLELSTYLLKNNYGMGYLENWFCEHIDGTEGQEKKFKEYFERRKKEKVTRYTRSYEEIQETESANSDGTVFGERVLDTIERYKKYIGHKVLDVGCNDGLGMQKLIEMGHEVTGIDVAHSKVSKAMAKGLNVVQGYMEDLPFEDKEFDTVFCSHTLEHSKDLEKAISEIKRVAKSVVIVIPVIADDDNPAHFSKFEDKRQLEERFSDWKILRANNLFRMEKEFVLVAEDDK